MSRFEDKLAVLATTRNQSLKSAIEAAGVVVPDQKLVRQMMEASRLGLRLTASERRIRFAWLRRRTHSEWRKFDWISYTTKRCPIYQHKSLSSQWGGVIPPEITRRVAVIQREIPDATVTVYATYTDPAIEVSRADEHIIVGLWIKGRVVI